MAEEQMMEEQMDDGGMAAGAPTPLTALEVGNAVLPCREDLILD